MEDVKQGTPITVTVKDSAGDPLVNATGSITPVGGGTSVSGATDADGSVRLSTVAGVTYTAGGSMSGFQNNSNVPVGNNAATVTLQTDTGNGLIRATVTSSASGNAAISGATVTATPSGGTAVSGTTNTSGIAAISVAAAERVGTTYSVDAKKSGYTPDPTPAQTTTVTKGNNNSLSFTLTPN
jgi:hypothetical protein